MGRYVIRYNGLILVTARTAQAIANYLEAMRLSAAWNIDARNLNAAPVLGRAEYGET